MPIPILDANGSKRDVSTLDDLIASYPVANATFRAEADGVPIDGPATVIGSAAAVNSIFGQVPCLAARAVIFHFPSPRGTGKQVAAQGTLDGSNWRNLTVHSLTGAEAPINGAFPIDSTLRFVEVRGLQAIRFQVTNSGDGSTVTVAARRISENMPAGVTAIKPTPYRVLSDAATGTAGGITLSTRTGYINGWRLRNENAAARYVHISTYNTSATPFDATKIVDTILLKPSERVDTILPGAGYASLSGFAFAVTTDEAAATLAGPSSGVTGTIYQSAW